MDGVAGEGGRFVLTVHITNLNKVAWVCQVCIITR